MFLGEYHHNIDEKGRMAIPVKFRQELGSNAIVTRGIDKCLFVFPKKEWEKFARKLIELPLTQSKSRAFMRLMLSGAGEVDFDSQGRVLIPYNLREYSEINKKVVIAGLYNRIEIWDEELWNLNKNETEKMSEEIAEKISELGI